MWRRSEGYDAPKVSLYHRVLATARPERYDAMPGGQTAAELLATLGTLQGCRAAELQCAAATSLPWSLCLSVSLLQPRGGGSPLGPRAEGNPERANASGEAAGGRGYAGAAAS